MLTYALSAFADEISADLDEQLDVLQRSEVRYLELRGVWRKNVLDLTDDEIGRVRSGLRERGVRVSAIGSPIGKVSITDDFDEHLRRFHRALDVARRLETPYIRVFSFYVPQDRDPAPLRDEVIRRMAALCDAADRFDP